MLNKLTFWFLNSIWEISKKRVKKISKLVSWICYIAILPILVFDTLNCRVEGSSKIQYRLEQQQQQMWNPPRTSNLEHHSPAEDKMSPESLMDDIERGKI